MPKRPKSQFKGFLENTEDFFKEAGHVLAKVKSQESVDQSFAHPPGQLPDHPSDHPPEIYPEFCITENQSTILAFLYTRKRKFTNKKIIQKTTGISMGTLKDAISALKQKNFIIQTKFKKYGNLSGFEY